MLDAMTAVSSQKATSAEYLALERSSETNQVYDGEIDPMAGGSPEHARLASKLGYLLETAFGDQPCRACSSDVRVRVEATGRSAYPAIDARHPSALPEAVGEGTGR
jgi:hypothetical protein